MTGLIPRSALFPDVARWLETGWPFADHFVLRIEDFLDDGNYVVRAEAPGLDPEKDIKITTEGGVLTISAERSEDRRERGHSEFRYGSFARSVTLPSGADVEHIQAHYDDGILEVKVPIKTKGTKSRQIPVTTGNGR